MHERDVKTLTGEVYDETAEITVTELCEVCSVEYTLIEQLVAEGILDPIDGRSDELRFHCTSVRRIRTVVRLDLKSTRLNSSHTDISRMPSSA